MGEVIFEDLDKCFENISVLEVTFAGAVVLVKVLEEVAEVCACFVPYTSSAIRILLGGGAAGVGGGGPCM